MSPLSRNLIALVVCFLFVSPQVYACRGVDQEYTLFFNANAQAQFIKDLGQAPSDAAGMVALPPDADVIAEVILTDEKKGFLAGAATAKIVRVIKTSDDRVRQGAEIPIKFVFTSCGPNHRSGNTGTIAAKIGTDIDDNLVLCMYARRFGDGKIESPSGSSGSEYIGECNPDVMKADKQVKQAAESGDVKAQITFGLMYEKGRSVRQNNVEALKWLHLAAESGDAEALYQLGAKYQRDKNDKEAMKWFKRAAEKGHEYAATAIKRQQEADAIENAAKQGNAEAQYKFGYKYDNEYNYVEAIKWYKLAAVQNHLKAANRLGKIYDDGGGGVQIDHAEAAKWYRLTAEKGDVEGQCGLGRQYGFLNQYSESLKWYKLAAEQGNSEAMERVATLYQYGRGVEQNDAEAIKWFRLALERGYTYVLPRLVDIVSQGRIVVENKTEVENWFRLSADKGYNVAQFGLGQMYQTGENVQQNDAEAIKWYLLAAGQGNIKAQNALAEMEQQGRGVTANYAEVEKLLQLAAEERIWRAKDVLESLQNRKIKLIHVPVN